MTLLAVDPATPALALAATFEVTDSASLPPGLSVAPGETVTCAPWHAASNVKVFRRSRCRRLARKLVAGRRGQW